MINMPDKSLSFDYENNFYLTCDSSRIGKLIAHYELYKLISNINGSLVECGVYKGASLARFSMFRKIHEQEHIRKIIAFDSFNVFPETNFKDDIELRKNFINDSGSQSISKDQMITVLKQNNCNKNTELIQGDICQTVPEFVKDNPGLSIALLNLDVDIYEPSVVILKYLFPLITKGGIIILDDYGTFPGETKAVDEYFKNESIEIKKFSFCNTPRYIIKN